MRPFGPLQLATLLLGPLPPGAPYTGLVATRGILPAILNTTNRQLMSRSPHIARTNITSLKIAIPNFMVQTASPYAEVGTGSAATVTSSIEHPVGTFTQVLFSGIAQGTVPNLSYLVSDSVSVTIPNGTLFSVRIYWVSTTGTLSVAYSLGTTGYTGVEQGVSGITDKTMSGSVTQSSTNFTPCAIIGTTTEPSFAIVGDSIAYGQGDTNSDITGDYGIVARSVGPFGGYMNMTRSGDQGAKLVASHTNRAALMTYASHMICQYGSNDLYTLGNSPATILADLQSIWGYITGLGGGRKAYQLTVLTRATSTDGWTTTANQTITSGNADRIALNALLRAVPAGLTACLDVADVMESARDSGKWLPGPSSNYYTSDGTHPVTNAYIRVRDSGVVWGPIVAAVAQASETDMAQPLTAAKLKTLGIAIETDLAQAIQRHKYKLVNQVVEFDLAQSVTPVRTTAIGQASELDAAMAMTLKPIIVEHISIGRVVGSVPTARSVQGVL